MGIGGDVPNISSFNNGFYTLLVIKKRLYKRIRTLLLWVLLVYDSSSIVILGRHLGVESGDKRSKLGAQNNIVISKPFLSFFGFKLIKYAVYVFLLQSNIFQIKKRMDEEDLFPLF